MFIHPEEMDEVDQTGARHLHQASLSLTVTSIDFVHNLGHTKDPERIHWVSALEGPAI
jgi:hypothetical protein